MVMKYNSILMEGCMVKKMNKSELIKKLQEKTHYSQEKCIVINNVLENHLIVGRKNKQKILNELISNAFTEDEAENIYDIAMQIILGEIKNKMKHPFN